MSDTNGIAKEASQSEVGLVASHGGRAGWFRVACGFSALAAIGMGYQSWSIARPATTASVFYPPSLAGTLAVGALLFAWASLLAMRRRPSAAIFLVLGYVIPAVALYAQQRMLVPPSLLLIASMLALILATRRRDWSSPDLMDTSLTLLRSGTEVLDETHTTAFQSGVQG